MHITQTYETPQAAHAAGIDVATLRTWQRQGVIQHCGDEPRPSYPRAYPVEGVYEMAMLAEMTRHGIERRLAMNVVRGSIAKWLEVDDPQTPELLRLGHARMKRIWSEYRDVTQPAILVFAADGFNVDNLQPAALEYAQGWSDVQRAVDYVLSVGKPTLVPTMSRRRQASESAAMPHIPFNVVHLVNVTAVLAGVDGRLNQPKEAQ